MILFIFIKKMRERQAAQPDRKWRETEQEKETENLISHFLGDQLSPSLSQQSFNFVLKIFSADFFSPSGTIFKKIEECF